MMRRILLIDDEEGIRMVWRKLHDVMEPTFRGQCELDTASSMEQAKQKLSTTVYDAVILDLGMAPEGQGAVMAWLANETGNLPPVIVLTGDEDIWVRRRCMMFGASQFFTKRDASEFPNLFFKVLYNEYLKRYGSTRETPTA